MRGVPSMSLITKYSKEELQEMSMIEVAFLILSENKSAISFDDLISKIAEAKDMSEKEIEKRIAQFYTDLNIEGRYMNIGDNMWGLKEWYPVDQQQDEELTLSVENTPRKKRKKRKKSANNDLLELDDEELEDDILLDEDEDEDDLDEDDFDEDESDLDDDFTDEIDDLAEDDDLDEDEDDDQ
jgi:DNA-directed RNA polymerase subunit delta